jgi:hypothetical protein
MVIAVAGIIKAMQMLVLTSAQYAGHIETVKSDMILLARELEMEYSGMVAATRYQTERILVGKLCSIFGVDRTLMLHDRTKQLSVGTSRKLFLMGFGSLSV